MTTSALPLRSGNVMLSQLRQGGWKLIVIILIAFAMRVGYLSTLGFAGDMTTFNGPWAKVIEKDGLFNVYREDETANYPPVYMVILWLSGIIQSPYNRSLLEINFVIILKLFSVVAEIGIVVLAYRWLNSASLLKWLLPLGLALYPGLIATSAFWGQSDSLLGLFLVLALLALNKDHPRAAWLWYALALLMKFQAIVMIPLMVILTFRRYGWRRMFVAVLLALLLFAVVYTPFILASGFDNALRPYLNTVDQYAFTTLNAFNFWFMMLPAVWDTIPINIGRDVPPDTTLFIADLTYKQFGLIIFAAEVAGICWMMWRQPKWRYEFVWAAALYLAFFVLPTQIHERYLYQAALLAVLAVAQERRTLTIALGLVVTFTYNIITITDKRFIWLGLDFYGMLGKAAIIAAILNLILLGIITIVVFMAERPIPIPDHD
jgi:dolichyl-phosphate-mannose-protein mannosyltransferase